MGQFTDRLKKTKPILELESELTLGRFAGMKVREAIMEDSEEMSILNRSCLFILSADAENFLQITLDNDFKQWEDEQGWL